MANKMNKTDNAPDVQQSDPPPLELLPIEQHQEQLKIKMPVFIGVCAVNGWKPGRVMAEAEFCLTVKERDGFRQAVSPCMIVIRCR